MKILTARQPLGFYEKQHRLTGAENELFVRVEMIIQVCCSFIFVDCTTPNDYTTVDFKGE
jgi:hypothetical protein